MSVLISTGRLTRGPTAKWPAPDSFPLSPALAQAETMDAYEADTDNLAAKQWAADFGTYLDRFVHLIPDYSHPVVDAGCGAGRDVAALVARGFRCVGVDVSSGMLARARARVLDPRAKWLHADMRSIPLESGVVGALWTNAALLHLDDKGQVAALKEFRRLLPPDRPLFVSTLSGSGWTSRRTAAGARRWFWGTDVEVLSKSMSSVGFRIVSAVTELGVVRGEWVNVLALAA